MKEVPREALSRMVTVKLVQRALGGDPQSPLSSFKTHPLVLPAHEEAGVLIDFSVLRVEMPLKLKRRARSEVEEMLVPLARLCDAYRRAIPPGIWHYDWYYLELADRDGTFKPVCWISPQLLHLHLPTKREITELKTTGRITWPTYRHQLIVMDTIAATNPATADDMHQREKWKQWFFETWRRNEMAWQRKGWLVVGDVRPWSQMLEFDPQLAREACLAMDRSIGSTGKVGALQYGADQLWEYQPEDLPAWRRYAYAGYPGLYWRLIPVFDFARMRDLWEAMKRELWVTSAFNIATGKLHDSPLWQKIEKRFALPFQRMTRYRYYIRLREQKVLEWTRQGKSLSEIARRLVEQGLHPLEPDRQGLPRIPNEEAWELLVASARRVAVRIRRRLREDGLIERGKPGRRKKTDHSP